MDAQLRRAVEEFKAIRRNNPDDPVSVSTRFQRFLVERGLATKNMDAISEAAVAAGVPEESLDIFFDELASWLQ